MKRKDFPDSKDDRIEKEATCTGAPEGPFFIIFTDLDGTLLDHETYDWKPALPAIEECKRRKFPIVPVSSKTRAEIEVIVKQMAISSPFVSENGGGIFFSPLDSCGHPDGAFFDKGLWKLSLGFPYARLSEALKEIGAEAGICLRGFSDMTTGEIRRLTGLKRMEAERSAEREFDEPFIIVGKGEHKLEEIEQAAGKRRLIVTRGGRFFHLQGRNGKAEALKIVSAWYRQKKKQVVSIALGDSPNDFGMLESADHPVLIRSSLDYSWLKGRIPRLSITESTGPGAWNSAVLDIFKNYQGGNNG